MENEKELNPQESLALIESMINKAQNRFSENGHLYLLWGWTVFVCSIVHFIMLKFYLDFSFLHVQSIQDPGSIWMLTWLAVIYQTVFISRKKKKQHVKTYTDEVGGYVWIAFVIMMFLMIFLMGKNNLWNKTYFIFLVLYGMPTFLSGVILKFKPLRIGGVICWLLALASAFVDSEYQLLLLSLAVISAWITPGYLLRSKYKIQAVL